MRVSVIIPTLNESANIGRCLKSLLDQKYADLEIIVVDGYSKDATRDIARCAGAKIILNSQHVQDVGKMLGLKASTGDIILMMDADNELVGDGYISEAVKKLMGNPRKLIGIESTYHSGPGMTAWNRYLTELLHISDPVSWLISSPPKQFNVIYCQSTGAWPLGANGFFFRRKDLEAAGIFRRDRFEDCAVAMEVAIHTNHCWLRVPGCGVRHYHSKGPRDFIAKRKRQAFHYLRYRAETNYRWLAQKPRMSVLAACFLCLTLVHPVCYALWQLLKTRRAEWLWHPVASLCSVCGLLLGIWAYSSAQREKKELGMPGPTDILEASLQPERQ